MFVLDASSALSDLLRSDWVCLSSVSFEPRWRGFVDLALSQGCKPLALAAIMPIDSGSSHEVECTARQRAGWATARLDASISASLTEIDLMSAAPWAVVQSIASELEARAGAGTVVLDATTFPRILLCPILAHLLRSGGCLNVGVAYAEPESYSGGELHSEPTGVRTLYGFDRIPLKKREAAWIPILGFGPTFADQVYEWIGTSHDLSDRIFPMFGFPGFLAGAFERALSEGTRLLKNSEVTANQYVYSPASDPFETRVAILNLINASPARTWFGSPMGPKPMTIGMVLAAIESDLTLAIDHARTYNPDYSKGVGRIHYYPLKRNGVKTY